MVREIRPPHTIELNTAYAVGSVNCFLLSERPVTLIDTGGKDAQESLEAALERLGHSLDEIEIVVLSHHHADHAGLANIIRERSGCIVVGHQALIPFLADAPACRRLETAFHVELLALHGVPADQVESHRRWQEQLIDLIDSVDLDVALADGDEVQAGGRRLAAVLRPGHSATDTLFVDREHLEAFVGDHLLADKSADPIAWLPRDRFADARTRPSALLAYRASLRLTRALELEVLYAGHGRTVTGHVELIDQRLAAHERHARRALAPLAQRPMNAYDLACAIWGQLAHDRPFDTVSAILSSLDLLESEGRVRWHEHDGVVLFSML